MGFELAERALGDAETRAYLLVVIAFASGVVHQFLGCFLYSNWWPLLTAFAYILLPMPYMFLADFDTAWLDASKFLTGAAIVGTMAVPAVLFTAGKISTGALWMEVGAVSLMVGSLVAYDALSEEHSSGGGFYSSI